MIALVFSKDRALQCDALLRSFAHQCLVPPTIVVLYTCSNEAHAATYRTLVAEHSRTYFMRETDFRVNVLRLLETREQVLFLVDDTIFVRPVQLDTISRLLREFPTALGVSLRLGRNTTYCYVINDAPQKVPDMIDVGDRYVCFNWHGAEHAFGYPLEVSSSVYRVADLHLDALPFNCPNALEGVLSEQAHRYRGSHPLLLCPETSVAFSAPLNRVQDGAKNRAGTHYSADDLLRKFEQGWRIDVAAYDGYTSRDTHEELFPLQVSKL